VKVVKNPSTATAKATITTIIIKEYQVQIKTYGYPAAIIIILTIQETASIILILPIIITLLFLQFQIII
jgi:hypothetical protein